MSEVLFIPFEVGSRHDYGTTSFLEIEKEGLERVVDFIVKRVVEKMKEIVNEKG
jgi:hypothetical protein